MKKKLKRKIKVLEGIKNSKLLNSLALKILHSCMFLIFILEFLKELFKNKPMHEFCTCVEVFTTQKKL